MILLTYFSFLFIILKLVLVIILFFDFLKKSKELIYLSMFTLTVEFIFIIISFFTNKVAVLLPFYLTYNLKHYPYFNILFLLIVLFLLVLYKGIEDNLLYLHKFIVAIYFIFSALPYLLLF